MTRLWCIAAVLINDITLARSTSLNIVPNPIATGFATFDVIVDSTNTPLSNGANWVVSVASGGNPMPVTCDDPVEKRVLECTHTFPHDDAGTHVLAITVDDVEVGRGALITYIQPPAKYLRSYADRTQPSVFSLAGHDFFTVKLEGVLPSVGVPRLRFTASKEEYFVPLEIVKKDGHTYLSGRTPSFVAQGMITDIAVHLSLNNAYYAAVPSKDGKTFSAKHLPSFKIGFIFHQDITLDNGWILQQNLAKLALEEKYGHRIETKLVVGPDSFYDSAKILLDNDGVDMLVGVTFNYNVHLVKLAAEYNDKRFLSTSPGSPADLGPNLARGWIRRYQAHYMQGYVLGAHPAVAANPRVGYIASFTGACWAEINAFAKGLREASGKQVTLFVSYVKSWKHDRRERVVAERFFKYYKVSAVGTICNSFEPYIVAANSGGYTVGSMINTMMSTVGVSVLSTAYFSWEQQLQLFVGAALNNLPWGEVPAGSDLEGFETPPRFQWASRAEGGWSLSGFSSEVPPDARVRIRARENDFVADNDDIFCGTLRNPSGGDKKKSVDMTDAEGKIVAGKGLCTADVSTIVSVLQWDGIDIRTGCTTTDEFVNGFCSLGLLDTTDDVPDDCPDGYAITTDGCSKCPAGRFANIEDVCEGCAPGRYSSAAGMKSCLPCAPNTFANSIGQSECHPCSAGHDQAERGGTECVACSPGTVSDGTAICTKCARGRFATLDKDACASCPANLVTDGGGAVSVDVCTCPPDQFLLKDYTNNAADIKCIECPKGVQCLGYGDGERVRAGFYSDWPITVTEGVWQCATFASCPGQQLAGEPGMCSPHAHGLNCGLCDEGYYMTGGLCEHCNKGDASMIYLLFMLLFIAVGLVYKFQDNNAGLRLTSDQLTLAVAINCGLMLLQCCGFLARTQLNWPSSTQVALDSMTVLLFDFRVLRTPCSIDHTFSFLYLSKLALPMVVVAFIGVWSRLGSCLNNVSRGRKVMFPIDSAFHTCGIFILAGYISIVSATCVMLECYESPNKRKALRNVPYVECGTREYNNMIPAAVFSVLIYIIGVMAMFIYLVYIAPWAVKQNVAWRVRLKFVICRYRGDRWWYGLIVLFRSFFISIVVLISPTDGYAQQQLLIVVLLVSLVITIGVFPYATRTANVLEAMTLIGMLLVLLFATRTLPMNDHDAKNAAGIGALQCTVIGTTLVVLIVAVIDAVVCHCRNRAGHSVCSMAQDVVNLVPKLVVLTPNGPAVNSKFEETLACMDHVDIATVLWTMKLLVFELSEDVPGVRRISASAYQSSSPALIATSDADSKSASADVKTVFGEVRGDGFMGLERDKVQFCIV